MKKYSFLFYLILISAAFVYASGAQDGGGDVDEVFTFASNGTFTFFDPHNSNTTQQVNLYEQVYEGLTARNENFVIEKGMGLAESWVLENDTTWRFVLQKGIKFHNGADFSAEDVQASFERAKQGTEGSISIAKNIIAKIEIVNDYELLVHTNTYVPVLPSAISSLLIMDKDWIEEYKVLTPLSSKDAEKQYTVDHANGTGPYKLVSLTPNEEIVFEKNKDYWNKARAGKLNNIRYITIEQDSTRISALISGDVDLIFPVPIQDWERIEKSDGISLYTGIESRPIFLGLDQHRDTLMGAENGAKANPFKDKRVREAVNLAIDIETINQKIMKGKALPIGIISAPGLGAHPTDKALNAAYPYDLERAKKLLADAGYPDGFSVVLDAPNNRYMNDEAIAQAIVAMLAKVNIKAQLVAQPRSTYFGKIFNERDTSIYMLGWHPIASHDFDIVTRLLAYPTEEPQLGGYNIGQYNNNEVTEIAKKLGQKKYNEEFETLIAEAYKISKEDFAYVPLLAPPLSVAIKSGYTFKVFPDEEISFRVIARK